MGVGQLSVTLAESDQYSVVYSTADAGFSVVALRFSTAQLVSSTSRAGQLMRSF